MVGSSSAAKPCASRACSVAAAMSRRESISVPSRSKMTAAAIMGGSRGVASRAEHRATHEERPHFLHVLGGLARGAHRLHHVRQRKQFLADQTDHEVIVVLIEPVTGEAHIVSEIAR